MSPPTCCRSGRRNTSGSTGFQPAITKGFRASTGKIPQQRPGLVIRPPQKRWRRPGRVALDLAGIFLLSRHQKRSSPKDKNPLGETAFRSLPDSLPIGLWSCTRQARAYGDGLYSGSRRIYMERRVETSFSGSVCAPASAGFRGAREDLGVISCGCVTWNPPSLRVMKGGRRLEMSECLMGSPKGRKLEGTGIVPRRDHLFPRLS